MNVSIKSVRISVVVYSTDIPMNLHSIINPEDYGGLGRPSVPESSLSVQGSTAAGRSARPSIHPQDLAQPSDHEMSQPFYVEQDKLQPKVRKIGRDLVGAKKASPNRSGHTSPRSRSSGGGRGDRKAADKRRKLRSSSSRTRRPAKEHQVDKQAIADLYSEARGHRVSIMDIVLDSKSSRAAQQDGVSPEDWMDDLEEHQRIALHDPSDEEVLREMVSPWWYGIRQARKWRGTPVAPVDCSSRRIYRVSAERSTAAWDPSLDSEESANTFGPYGTAY